MTRLRTAFAAAAILAAGAANAAATPAGKLTATEISGGVQEAASWGCGPYHCYWHPNYYGGWHSRYSSAYGGARWGWQ